MSFKARLSVAGKNYNVLDCSYSLRQEIDATGRPSSVTRGGRITISVESNNENDLFDWMCNNWERKEGSVVFLKRDSDATMKELKFKEAYLIDFEEKFTSDNEKPMRVTFTLSAMEISMGTATHKNEWVS
jgi:Hemolysin coregulated protein Hcp (TssD)